MEGQYGHVMKLGGGGSMSSNSSSSSVQYEDDHQSSEDDQMMMMTSELRRGPWTVEEDLTLMNYIANHGEGRWNSLARCAGLKRTGKSCRLRWLNYLRPDVRRGNITLEEQLLILELHSRWGNRWSKIAQHLPGRTDNEIKNYWRTRVQKHAKQLKCDVNSKQFKDTMRYLWMPRLVERIHATSSSSSSSSAAPQAGPTTAGPASFAGPAQNSSAPEDSLLFVPQAAASEFTAAADHHSYSYNYNTATAANPNSAEDHCYIPEYQYNAYFQPGSTNDAQAVINGGDESNNGAQASLDHHFQGVDAQWSYDQQTEMSLWNNVDDIWFLQQQLNSNGL